MKLLSLKKCKKLKLAKNSNNHKTKQTSQPNPTWSATGNEACCDGAYSSFEVLKKQECVQVREAKLLKVRKTHERHALGAPGALPLLHLSLLWKAATETGTVSSNKCAVIGQRGWACSIIHLGVSLPFSSLLAETIRAVYPGLIG